MLRVRVSGVGASRDQGGPSDRPFFVYFAPGATHAPHHVLREWIEKFRGQFDQGWDRYREETFARQQTFGLVPPDARLTRRPKEIPPYDYCK